jgi:acylpyruvate hydrolase
MRFASCTHGGRTFAAALMDGTAVPLAGIAELGAETPTSVLADPPLDLAGSVPLDEVTLRAVVPRPAKIVCVGLNYLNHVGETGREIPEYPVLFTKFAETLTGPGDPIAVPPESSQVDYEGELAVVIGRPGRRIPSRAALTHVAGYTIANDVTMRDFQYKTHQWLQGKAWQASTPVGPWLVTPEEAGDPSALDISLVLNDTVMQQANTGQLMFDIPELIARVSEIVMLVPGDLILTGTPGGVGFRRDPQVFLKPGDRVRVEISGIGALDNPVVAETSA